jgi:lambda repressor-like predicted transcriptional regulator
MAHTRTWGAWKDMKARCLNTKLRNYHRYGGRGITVCERWMKFENFLEDMGVRPDGMTLERKDNDGNYEPGNVIWASRFAQARNTRRNRYLTINGETQTISEWSREAGQNRETIRRRLSDGWKDIDAVFGKSERGVRDERSGRFRKHA